MSTALIAALGFAMNRAIIYLLGIIMALFILLTIDTLTFSVGQ
jgi:hypothetical protein